LKDKNDRPGVLTRSVIVDHHKDLPGPQLLTGTGEVWALNKSDTVLVMEYNYIDFGTFPTVL